jgi:N-formylglutamate amidohydrolase
LPTRIQRKNQRFHHHAALNEPFAGGHVIDRHAWPARNVHALQLEVDRRCYLDEHLAEPGPGFDRTAAFIEARRWSGARSRPRRSRASVREDCAG